MNQIKGALRNTNLTKTTLPKSLGLHYTEPQSNQRKS